MILKRIQDQRSHYKDNQSVHKERKRILKNLCRFPYVLSTKNRPSAIDEYGVMNQTQFEIEQPSLDAYAAQAVNMSVAEGQIETQEEKKEVPEIKKQTTTAIKVSENLPEVNL